MVSSAWSQYFNLIVGVAIGVAGILFVCIQLTRYHWQGDSIGRCLLVETFAELLVPIFVALGVLLPARWPTEWEPLHQWVMSALGRLHLANISSIWQVVGIAVGLVGLIVAATSVWKIIDVWSNRKKPGAEQPVDHHQVWFEWIPFITFPTLIWQSIQGNLNVVGVLTLWFVFSGMFETWLLFRALYQARANVQV